MQGVPAWPGGVGRKAVQWEGFIRASASLRGPLPFPRPVDPSMLAIPLQPLKLTLFCCMAEACPPPGPEAVQ